MNTHEHDYIIIIIHKMNEQLSVEILALIRGIDTFYFLPVNHVINNDSVVYVLYHTGTCGI